MAVRGGHRRPTVPVDTDLGVLSVFADDTVMRPWMQHYKSWEPEEAALIARVLRPGGSFLDVGANVGYHTLGGLRAVGPGGHVVAVEVDRQLVPVLRSNIERNIDFDLGSTFKVIRAAAWDRPRLLWMTRDAHHNWGDQRVFGSRRPTGTPVPGLPLDLLHVPLWRRVGRLDLVKTDLQGRDHVALRGLRRTLRRFRPVVVSEFWPTGIAELGDHPRDVLQSWPADTRLGALEHPERGYVAAREVRSLDDLLSLAEGHEQGFLTVVAVPSGQSLPELA